MASALQLLAGHIQFCSSFETRICQIFQQYFLIWVFCICWPTTCGNQYKVKQVLRLAQGGGWMLELWHGFLIIANFVFLGEFWIADFHNFDWFSLDLSDVFPFSGATVCKAMTFPLLLSLRDDKYNFTKWAFTCPDNGFPQQIPAPRLEKTGIRHLPSTAQRHEMKLNEKVGKLQSMS